MTYQHPEPPDELLEQFDEHGSVIEPITRAEVKLCTEKPWLGVVNVYIVNRNGELLTTKRSAILSGNPNKWQTYCGGHLKTGQPWLEAAIAELQEEVGISISESDLKLLAEGKDEKWRKFFKSYALLWDHSLDQLHFNDGEITDAHWMSFENYRIERAASPDSWCNNCSPEREEQIKTFLIDKPPFS